jgi:hypothetical protein
MVRKQIYIEPHHDALLKRLSRQLGISEAELVRRGIGDLEQRRPVFKPDARAWAESRAMAEERERMNVPQTGRQWKRDELYDEKREPLAP